MFATINDSNKMIKITQFNSNLIIGERKISGRQKFSISPQKPLNLNKLTQLKLKATIKPYKVIQISLKKQKKQWNQDRKKLFIHQLFSDQKTLATVKCNISKQWSNIQSPYGQYEEGTQVAIFKSQQMPIKHKQMDIFCQKNINDGKQMRNTVIQSKNSIQFNTNRDYFDRPAQRRSSASPTKRYKKQLEQKKKFQQKIQQQRKQKLLNRKQLTKNYAKPFNPPEGVTAFAYLIYEAQINNQKIKKINRPNFDQIPQIKKIFLHSHKVIAAHNSRTVVQMASITKIMTCIVAIQLAQTYRLNLSNCFAKIGLFQQNISGTTAGIKKGQIYSIQQLLYGLMLPSGNDASLAIAVWGGKLTLEKQKSQIFQQNNEQKPKITKRQSYERFLELMNSKCQLLGMQKTKYASSHGLSNSENKSCAYDIAILCEYAMKNTKFRQVVSRKVYETQIQYEIQDYSSNKNLIKQRGINQSPKLSDKRISNSNLLLNRIVDSQLRANDELRQSLNSEIELNQPVQRIFKRKVRWQNTHELLQRKSDIYVGIKTGVTTTAGPCLSSCIQIKGRRFIIIVLNCKSMKYRVKDTQILRKWLFTKQNIKHIQLKQFEEELQQQDQQINNDFNT